ncbi:hypothetical protein [Noviherbaspirillum pedocola]|uniref:Uncharacterized protein n=1 Tax=Noviherbaspirillum pedocola TaxID=2801341 RepID=A0A934SNA7_9BURK|nr:hypothetical protein [Noviherbaspirillum pedocola]MBK4733696.1 hypothetical protein [Noviherbaspirillum pedocola]
MGDWMGRGKWVYSWEEKRAYAEKKKQEYLYSLNKQKEEKKKNFFTLTQLRSFLSSKDVEEFFPSPDETVRTKFGSANLFKIRKVLSLIKKNRLAIQIKKPFYCIENEEAKEKVLHLQKEMAYLELNKKLIVKHAPRKSINKI